MGNDFNSRLLKRQISDLQSRVTNLEATQTALTKTIASLVGGGGTGGSSTTCTVPMATLPDKPTSLDETWVGYTQPSPGVLARVYGGYGMDYEKSKRLAPRDLPIRQMPRRTHDDARTCTRDGYFVERMPIENELTSIGLGDACCFSMRFNGGPVLHFEALACRCEFGHAYALVCVNADAFLGKCATAEAVLNVAGVFTTKRG